MQSIVGLVDYNQSIPKLKIFHKFSMTWQITYQAIVCPPALQNTMGTEYIETETNLLALSKQKDFGSVLSTSH